MYFGNSVQTYLWFLGTFIASVLLIQLVKRFLFKRFFEWISKKSDVAERKLLPMIRRYLPLFLYVNAFYMSISMLTINAYLQKLIDVAIIAIAIYLAAVVLAAAIDFFFAHYQQRNKADENRVRAMRWIGTIAKGVLWTFAVILFLANMGVEIDALVTGLGIGGVAIAFAAQEILEDVFGYFTIFFDRPFEVGDFVIVGDYLGTIEHIGVRTTRVRSLGGEQLVFPNKDLTSARMKNYKTMQERRVIFSIGVTYDTPIEKLKKIPSMIRDIIESQEKTRFDRTHFFAYGDSSLKYEIVYYVLSPEYNVYMDIQQDINFKIREIFDANGIEFAFPTRTLYIQESVAAVSDSTDMLKG